MNLTHIKKLLFSLGILISGIFIGWLLFGGKSASEHENHQLAEGTAQTLWTCSMHPQIKQKEPGDCPLCGMDLIPLTDESSDAADPSAIRMSPTAMQLADIQTAVVGKESVLKSIRLSGKVQADERLRITQASHISGRIERLLINFTGDFVAKGQTIAYVYSPELVTAQKELLEAKRFKESQPALFRAAQEKLKHWKLSDAQISELLASEQVIEQFPIITDAAGFISRKLVNLGDYVKSGQALYEVTDLSRVWVLFDIYELDMAWVKKGQVVNYTVASLPNQTFKGTISYIDPNINPKTRVAQARVEIQNQGFILKPEMFASGIIEAKLSNQTNALAIPKSAVMWTGKRSLAYVKSITDQGVQFQMRELMLGPSLGDSYIVEKGLTAGEEIAVNGTFSIDAAAQLAGKNSMMNPPAEPIAISDQAKEALLPLFQAYFLIKDHLTKDDFAKAQEASGTLQQRLAKIPMKLFEKEAHGIWHAQAALLTKHTAQMAASGDIEQLRMDMIAVSKAMIALATSFTPLEQALFVQHCPMANRNTGADWLSKEESIINPYFGKAMLSCGEVVKIIR